MPPYVDVWQTRISLDQLPERVVLVTVNAKGQITIPKKVRDAAGIGPGDRVTFRVLAPGRILLRKVSTRTARKQPSK